MVFGKDIKCMLLCCSPYFLNHSLCIRWAYCNHISPQLFYLFVFCQLMLCPGDTRNWPVNSANTKKPVHICLKLSHGSSKHFKVIIPLVYKWKLLDPTDSKRPPQQRAVFSMWTLSIMTSLQ